MELFDKLEIGVQIIDHEYRYVFLNKSLLKSTQKSLDEHLGKKMTEVYPGIDETGIYKTIEKCLKNKKSVTFQSEFLFPDGRQTFWENIVEKIDEGVIIFSRDITDSKLAEKYLVESNLKLIHQKKELEDLNRKIKQVMGYVAHDLRLPFANNISLIELIELDPENSKKYLDQIKNISENGLEFIYEILNASAIEEGRTSIEPEPISLKSLIESKLMFFGVMIQQNKQKLIHEISDQKFMADEMNIDRVISNLVSNAVKYSPEGSTLEVSLSDSGLFRVKNKVDVEKVEKAKESFNVRESIGFGLDIVKTILEKHSSKLKITEDDGFYCAEFQLTVV